MLDKRLKRVTVDLVDCEGAVAVRGPKCADQLLAAPFDWSQLPYAILLQVFRYLSNSDKYHAALTCKSWLRPLSVPSLWQSGDFVFNSKSDQKAIRFVRIVGKTLRHIKAECAEKTEEIAYTENLYQFVVALLNTRNHQFVTFKLTNLTCVQINDDNGIYRSKDDVAELLGKLLEAQQQLRVLDLSNSQVSVKTGYKMLKAASKNSAKTIRTLAINRLIDYMDDVFIDKFLTTVTSFRNLSDLDLSYDYVCDDLLLHLAQRTRSLELMTVRAQNYTTFRNKTTPAAWKKLTKACPELRVIFFIKPTNVSCLYI